jgi:hypothetical protein
MNIINENILDKLEEKKAKDKENEFLVFSYDLPSERIENLKEEEMAQLKTKRTNFKNYLDKFSIYVNDSVYLIRLDKLRDLIEKLSIEYEDEKLKKEFKDMVKFTPIGFTIDKNFVKEIIIEQIKEIEKDSKNFFEYVLDMENSKKILKKIEIDKLKNDYKKVIKKLNINLYYRVSDLNIIDKPLSNSVYDKLRNILDSKYDVLNIIQKKETDYMLNKNKK